MLASVRHSARCLSSRCFSTTAGVKSIVVNSSLTGILDDTATKQPPRTPTQPLHTTPYPNYKIIKAGEVLLPNSLTYKHLLRKPKIYKKQGVAPGPAITHHTDVFHQLDLDPRHFTNNSVLLSNYVSEMGKIKTRADNELTLKNQRLIGRTIRRAKMMGIIPTLSKGFKRHF